MKKLLVITILLGFPLRAQPAGNCAVADCPDNFMPTPVRPSLAAKKKVELALSAVKTAELNEDAAVAQLEDRLNIIRFELENENKRHYFRRAIKDEDVRAAALSDQEYLFRQETLRKAINAAYLAHNAAIREAIDAYHLVPHVTDFTGDPRGANPNMVAEPWMPHYSRQEIYDPKMGRMTKRTDADLVNESRKNGYVSAAKTLDNGVIQLYGQAFQSPDKLAILLFHETSHWVDIAGKSGGFARSDMPQVSFRTEQHAFERAAAFAVQIGADPTLHLQMAARFESQAIECEQKHLTWPQVILKQDWIGRNRNGSLALVPLENEITGNDEALLQKMLEKAQAETAAKAKEQLKIVHREQDARLRDTLIELTDRSCAAPGSVSQSELDELPRPHDKNFYFEDPATERFPYLRGNCITLYLYLALGGSDAQELAKRATPPVAIQPSSPPEPANRIIPLPPFSTILPQIKSFAISACSNPDQVPLDDIVNLPYDLLYRKYDENLVRRISKELDDCPRQLFLQLIATIRAGDFAQIDRRWIQERAAAFSPSPPPSGGGGGRRKCEDYGNIRCP